MATWAYCQENSDVVLAGGLDHLRRSPRDMTTVASVQGNYLISHMDDYVYIGEAKDVRARLKQQFSLRTSTFYKTYLDRHVTGPAASPTEIATFDVRYMQTRLGRKEIEEFGIVNLPANLNKFQVGKRARYVGTPTDVWHDVQANFAEILNQGETALLDAPAADWFSAVVDKTPGLYYVEHPERGLIYIGESSNIRDRYDAHSEDTYFSALRRHIGEDILGFTLQVRKGKKRYFAETEDPQVTRFLAECRVRTLAVHFARFELEEYLIRKYRPLLNRKDNK